MFIILVVFDFGNHKVFLDLFEKPRISLNVSTVQCRTAQNYLLCVAFCSIRELGFHSR